MPEHHTCFAPWQLHSIGGVEGVGPDERCQGAVEGLLLSARCRHNTHKVLVSLRWRCASSSVLSFLSRYAFSSDVRMHACSPSDHKEGAVCMQHTWVSFRHVSHACQGTSPQRYKGTSRLFHALLQGKQKKCWSVTATTHHISIPDNFHDALDCL